MPSQGKSFDKIIYIGRFQPLHSGHMAVVRRARELADEVIVLVGSSNRARSVKNPFTFEERRDMIRAATNDSFHVRVVDLPDSPYNDTAWVTDVNAVLRDETSPADKVGLIGYAKDESSYYLTMFPRLEFVDVGEQFGTISATDIREQFFQRAPIISEFLPEAVRHFMREFMLRPEFKYLLGDYEYVREYPKLWGPGPFVTVDSVCVQSGHVLLVTRGQAPFRGCLALPGGFLDIRKKERIAEARVRELKEETRVSDSKGEIPPAMLASFLVREKVYDDPDRSSRGRVITHAGLFMFPNRKRLFSVRGDDDAAHAAWYPISELDPTLMMEDHYFILTDMLGI